HDMDLMLWLTGSRPDRVASFGGLNFFRPENAHYNDLYEKKDDGYGLYERGLASGFAVGQEKNVSPFTEDKDTIDNQVAIMELANQARVSFHFCMHSAQQERRFYMSGTRGAIRADVLTGTAEYTPVGWEPETETVTPIKGGGHGAAEDPMTEDILACMFDGTPMPTTMEDGLNASFTCFGLEEARQTGQVIDMSKYWDAVPG
ncbi:MAG: Gfo/Idh/MocA family oxidoreductase, partial [Phycisphaeraceae bacterium]|nr:Gfo/Idh/MocA family oxidoreductase [Phycisphaeraceae bacterium]